MATMPLDRSIMVFDPGGRKGAARTCLNCCERSNAGLKFNIHPSGTPNPGQERLVHCHLLDHAMWLYELCEWRQQFQLNELRALLYSRTVETWY
jgi:hypothetical protein